MPGVRNRLRPDRGCVADDPDGYVPNWGNLSYDASGFCANRGRRYDPKRGYAPGESITVTFNAPPGLPNNAWVGVIPSSVTHGSEVTNDQNDISYKYLEGKTYGTLVFTAPTTPGNYDLRMNSSDNSGAELTYVSFTVSGGTAPSPASLSLNTYSVSPGGSIAVTFSAPAGLSSNAWIGIIPSWVAHGSEATNDQYDLSYQYLSGNDLGDALFQRPDGSRFLRLSHAQHR